MAKKSSASKMDSMMFVSWLALAIALFALAVSLGLTSKLKDKVSEDKMIQETSLTVNEQLAAAQTKLEEVQKLIKASKFDQAEMLLSEVRSDIKSASADLTGDAKMQ